MCRFKITMSRPPSLTNQASGRSGESLLDQAEKVKAIVYRQPLVRTIARLHLHMGLGTQNVQSGTLLAPHHPRRLCSHDTKLFPLPLPQDPQELVRQLESCLKLNEAHQEQYRLTKAKLQQTPRGKQFDFSETEIFGESWWGPTRGMVSTKTHAVVSTTISKWKRRNWCRRRRMANPNDYLRLVETEGNGASGFRPNMHVP